VSGQQHAPAALYPLERHGTYCTGGWVGPWAGLDGRKISSPPGFDPGPSSQVTQSLYRLSYLAHLYILSMKIHHYSAWNSKVDLGFLENLYNQIGTVI
jgi:hypothetical protein